MEIKYKGLKIKIIVHEYNFDYISFKYGKYIMIYLNKKLCEKDISSILHKSLKKIRK